MLTPIRFICVTRDQFLAFYETTVMYQTVIAKLWPLRELP